MSSCLGPTQLAVLDYLHDRTWKPATDAVKPKAWQSAVYTLRRRGYQIDMRYISENRTQYRLRGRGYDAPPSSTMRTFRILTDTDLEIIADLVTERLMRRAKGAAA